VRFIAIGGAAHFEAFSGAVVLDIESGTFGAGTKSPDGGPDSPIAKLFDGWVGTELRVLVIRQQGASIYMSGPVLRVLEVWKPGCPLCLGRGVDCKLRASLHALPYGSLPCVSASAW